MVRQLQNCNAILVVLLFGACNRIDQIYMRKTVKTLHRDASADRSGWIKLWRFHAENSEFFDLMVELNVKPTSEQAEAAGKTHVAEKSKNKTEAHIFLADPDLSEKGRFDPDGSADLSADLFRSESGLKYNSRPSASLPERERPLLTHAFSREEQGFSQKKLFQVQSWFRNQIWPYFLNTLLWLVHFLTSVPLN